MLTKDSIKAIHDYAAETISYVFPGLFLLETIYHKGIFSISLTTSYDFIILLFWSMAISILYHHIAFYRGLSDWLDL